MLVQFLQLVEGADDVGLVGQLLGSLTQTRLHFKVLLEVVFASLAVQFQQVVELLHVELIVAPQLVSALSRHSLDFAPLLLQFLELLERPVGLVGRCGHSLYFLDDLKFTFQVVLLFRLLRLENLSPLFLDDVHLGLESLFLVVGSHLIGFRVATGIEIFFLLGLALGDMQFVEEGLQQVDFGFVHILVFAMGNLPDALQNFSFRLVNLGGFLFCSWLAGFFGNLGHLFSGFCHFFSSFGHFLGNRLSGLFGHFSDFLDCFFSHLFSGIGSLGHFLRGFFCYFLSHHFGSLLQLVFYLRSRFFYVFNFHFALFQGVLLRVHHFTV